MPVCPHCDIAFIEWEPHECRQKSSLPRWLRKMLRLTLWALILIAAIVLSAFYVIIGTLR